MIKHLCIEYFNKTFLFKLTSEVNSCICLQCLQCVGERGENGMRLMHVMGKRMGRNRDRERERVGREPERERGERERGGETQGHINIPPGPSL